MRDWAKVFQHFIFIVLLLNVAALANAKRGRGGGAPHADAGSAVKWQTLSGNAPVVIARGGYSGVFPESSQIAYRFAMTTSVPDVVLYCDMQLTKDGVGFCHTGLSLSNSTNIKQVFPDGHKTYSVNGESMDGWFSVDYGADDLFKNVSLIQNIFSRPSVFDNTQSMAVVDEVAELKPPQFWLNVQYNNFFKEHKLDMAEYILSSPKEMALDYISSPEIDFLKGLNGKVDPKKTKLVFKFLEADKAEPSTNKTYESLLQDLSGIKSFASGILVPKQYIWPVNKDLYLQPATTLVVDAHKQGLEVYAYNFANDAPASYNYSYDPTAEYLQFVDNSEFSVDGVLTDFPSTASGAIACLAHTKNNTPPSQDKPLIITHNGASGVYTGCTDLAYQQAVEDKADVIDCSVQMSKDGVIFCLNSADLTADTTALASFMSLASSIPEIQTKKGIFSFDLTWSQILTLKPALSNPMSHTDLKRNPAMKNAGKFMTLAEFLDYAKSKSVLGILISIENAAYLASKKGFDVVDAVLKKLSIAGYDKQTTQTVYIQSDDTSVLEKFKAFSYKRVLVIKETIGDIPKPAVSEIKQFADAVNLPRSALVSFQDFFLSSITPVAKEMFAANITVFVSVLRNEFMALAFDYFSDPMTELASFLTGLEVDGVITEYPATANAYMKSPCYYSDAKMPYTISPVEPGSLLSLVPPELLPPAVSPAPALQPADVVDPPLPPVSKMNAPETLSASDAVAAPPPKENTEAKTAMNAALLLSMMLLSLMYLSLH